MVFSIFFPLGAAINSAVGKNVAEIVNRNRVVAEATSSSSSFITMIVGKECAQEEAGTMARWWTKGSR